MQSLRDLLLGPTDQPKDNLAALLLGPTCCNVGQPTAEAVELLVEGVAGTESREAEVVQITEQVLKFKAAALHGVRCTYFSELDKHGMSAVYALDADVQNFMVFSGDSLEFIEVVCPIERILEIYSFTDATKHVFPEAVLAATQPADRDALLMGVFQRKLDDAVVRFCILLGSVKARNVFVESLTVLAVCRRARRKSPIEAMDARCESNTGPRAFQDRFSGGEIAIPSVPIQDVQPLHLIGEGPPVYRTDALPLGQSSSLRTHAD